MADRPGEMTAQMFQNAQKAVTGPHLTADDESAPRYRPDIDGLRAIAVTIVVLFHAGVFPFQGGFVGVDAFFVISGFLIGGIVHRDAARGRFSFVTFYARRARRILPALIAMVCATAAVGLAILSPIEMQRLSDSGMAALLGVSNLWFRVNTTYFSPDAHLDPYLMTWSLGVEEQFYLVFPLLMLALHRFAPKRIFLILAVLSLGSLVLSAVLTFRFPVSAFYLLPTRAWELGLGAMAAVIPVSRPMIAHRFLREMLSVFGLLAIGAALYLFNEQTFFPGLAALLPVLGALALICSEGSLLNRKLLAARPVVGLGLISYSWYLWHWPLMAMVRVCFPGEAPVHILVAVALLSLPIAYLSWRFIETPFRHLGPAKSPRTTNIRVLRNYALAVTALIALLFGLRSGLPFRMAPAGYTIHAMLIKGSAGPCLSGYGQVSPNQSAACGMGDKRANIVLLGDSHAAALAPALKAIAEAHGYGFKQLTKASCPPLSGVTRQLPSHPGHAGECLTYNDRALADVIADKQNRIVVLAGFWSAPFEPEGRAAGDAYRDRVNAGSGATALQNGLSRTLALFASAGRRVILVGDAPSFSFDPARQAFADALPARRAVQEFLAPSFQLAGGIAAPQFVTKPARDTDRIVQEAVAAAPNGAQYISLADTLCTPTGCRVSMADVPYYIDSQHLSQAGAQAALAPLSASLTTGGTH
jgi:peptidoglycan/LPS O-acetylase OafA/YrhL